MAVTVLRRKWPNGTVGYKYIIGIPVDDEDAADFNLDGATLTCKAEDPAGNKITPTLAQRTAGSSLMDMTITAAQMTTGDEGTWKVDVYVNSERPQFGRFTFLAEPKETE